MSGADWGGGVGDKARRALADTGDRAGGTGTTARLAGTLFARQSRALSTARATVPPPPAHPFDARTVHERLMTITDPVVFGQQPAADRAAFDRQREDHPAAARVVEAYDRTVARTAAAQPAFAPSPEAPPRPEPAAPAATGGPVEADPGRGAGARRGAPRRSGVFRVTTTIRARRGNRCRTGRGVPGNPGRRVHRVAPARR
ncbi:hypothetical protein [Saccharothrix yanglingensis]|uniref:hypothetical protein n=1 Tax=Saccharothrix yanglingensis TaxID=659496 RepID=UPI0027D335D5|nr:hypothetical protein [Saccharothrix yanglingensis]